MKKSLLVLATLSIALTNLHAKVYTSEFKSAIALEALKGAKTVEEIAAENDLSVSLVKEWKEHVLEYLPKSFDEQKHLEPPAGNRANDEVVRTKEEKNWNLSASFNVAHNSASGDPALGLGDNTTYGTSLSAEWLSKPWLVEGTVYYNYTELEGFGAQVDNWGLDLGVHRALDENWIVYNHTAYGKSQVDDVTSFVDMLGIGYEFDGENHNLFVGPHIGYMDLDHGPTSTSGAFSVEEVGAGVLESFTYHFSKYVTLTQDLRYINSLESNAYLLINEATLETMLNEHVGVQLSYNYSYKSTIKDPFKKDRTGITAGMTFKY